jgi:hypothetical protein
VRDGKVSHLRRRFVEVHTRAAPPWVRRRRRPKNVIGVLIEAQVMKIHGQGKR